MKKKQETTIWEDIENWRRKRNKFINIIKKIKLTLPLAIVLVGIILGGAFFAIQINKQKSIERQQKIKLQDDRRLEEVKVEQAKREHIAKRKQDCYDIYDKERDAYSNVLHMNYDEKDDICRISYKAVQGEWSDTNCEDIKPDPDSLLFKWSWQRYFNCKENVFDKEF